MNGRDWLLLLVRTSGFALVTAIGGWLTIPVTAAIWSALPTNERHREVKIALAAAACWALMLLWGARQGDTGRLLDVLGGTLQVPPASLVALTLALPALLAWSASEIATFASLHARGILARRGAPPA